MVYCFLSHIKSHIRSWLQIKSAYIRRDYVRPLLKITSYQGQSNQEYTPTVSFVRPVNTAHFSWNFCGILSSSRCGRVDLQRITIEIRHQRHQLLVYSSTSIRTENSTRNGGKSFDVNKPQQGYTPVGFLLS